MEERELIRKIINQCLGISTCLKGSHYLEEAVALLLQNPNTSVMEMYQIIAHNYDKSTAGIEHTIRYAIEKAYDSNKLYHNFPYALTRPSNSEVIWTIAEHVKKDILIIDACGSQSGSTNSSV